MVDIRGRIRTQRWWPAVAILGSIVAGGGCSNDVAGANSFGSEGSGGNEGGTEPAGSDGMLPGEGDDSGTAGGTADDTGGASASADGNDDGGVEGELCMGTQMGLCEIPGQVVHCYSGAPDTCGVGPCAGGTQTCETFDLDLGEWTACEGEVVPARETCDGIDNDCDGEVDEDLGTTDCGIGLCAHTQDDCVDGAAVACDPSLGADTETCDGIDNDCDGDIDEDFAGQTASCGVGQCEHLVAACVDGMEPTCDPLAGQSVETCDDVDNDCDGQTDEGLGMLTCGVGQCAHSVPACSGGEAQICDEFDGSAPETCDGLDNDCDGQADEGFGIVQCGVGACAHDLQTCVDGELQVCNPTQGAAPEACDDGIDNDCDGQIDENCGCGNGMINAGEECDGNALGGQTCLTLGFDGGTLACNADCTLDESGCYMCMSEPLGLGDPSVPPPPPPPGPGGCDPIVSTLTCSSTYEGQVQSGNSSIDGPYTCGEPYAPLDQVEGEDVYSFTCQADGSVDLVLTGMDCDLDIYVLSSMCNPDAGCIAGSTMANTATDTISFPCTAGSTYYIVIEGWGWQNIFPPGGQCGAGEGNYTLQFSTGDATGGCLEDCDDGIDNDVDGPIDCADSDCIADPVCKNPCPPP